MEVGGTKGEEKVVCGVGSGGGSGGGGLCARWGARRTTVFGGRGEETERDVLDPLTMFVLCFLVGDAMKYRRRVKVLKPNQDPSSERYVSASADLYREETRCKVTDSWCAASKQAPPTSSFLQISFSYFPSARPYSRCGEPVLIRGGRTTRIMHRLNPAGVLPSREGGEEEEEEEEAGLSALSANELSWTTPNHGLHIDAFITSFVWTNGAGGVGCARALRES